MAHDTVSWHRSQTDPGHEGPLDATEFAALFEDIDVDDFHPDLASEAPVTWKCAQCGCTQWTWSLDFWVCEQCGSKDFYNPASPSRYETEDGVWMYMPNHMSPPLSDHGCERLSSKSPAQSPHSDQGKPESSDGGWMNERGDSESYTTDPVVEPDTLQPVSGGRRRRRRKNPADVGESEQPTLPIPQRQNDEPNTMKDLLQVMRQLVSEQSKSNKSDASWNSRRGPEKGVRWRGGTPPAPPAWKGSSADLRAFARWERRIDIWKLQIRSYMSEAEAALMLFTSLTGEPEQEVEHLDLAKVNSSSGISYIVDSLREPLQQRTLFQKRKLLADYEQVGRNNTESIRQYVNRYKRIERDLETVGISSGSMYDDGESRGNRLLERAKLAPDLQRLVLIAAGNSLEFDKIQEAMCLQFPDFRAPPPLHYVGSGSQNQRHPQHSNHRNDRWNSKASGSSNSSSSSSTSAGSSSYRSGGSKGFGRGTGVRRVFQTEHQQDDLADIPENDEQQDDEQNDDDDAEYQDACEDGVDQQEEEGEAEASPAEIIGNLASVLTVTSKKLQSTVLGRKFTGGNRSIEERKKTSSCTACGQVGHWAGDSCCPAGPKPSRKGAGKSDNKHGGGKGGAQRDQGGSNNKPKKTFVVSCPDQFSGEIDPDMLPSELATFYNFPARFVVGEQACTTYVTEVVDFAGYMILDTACQRSCLGRKWLDVHSKILKKFSLPIVQIEATDTFQFGSGEPETSSERVHIPVAFEGQQSLGVVLGSSVLDVQIPFLASHTMMTKLGFVIDLTVKKVFISSLDISFDLELRNDHLVAKIVCFHGRMTNDSGWNDLMMKVIQHEQADPEVNWVESNSAQAPAKQCLCVTGNLQMLRQPPTWLTNWRALVLHVMLLPLNTFKMMLKMVKLGMKNRIWVTIQEAIELRQEQTEEIKLLLQRSDPSTCTHPHCKRYGNRHGRYCQCLRCGQKFRWDHLRNGWEVHGHPSPSGSSALPPPSLESILPPQQHLALRASTAKPKPRPSTKRGAYPLPIHMGSQASEMSWQDQNELNPEEWGDLTFLYPDSDNPDDAPQLHPPFEWRDLL